ncbi:hypothetical protein KSP40_PGU006175 [Platanthera guangdongensis]|uniref:Uncharacterized protein n=1 Tax=Platanthera guangdongensis TaxID=2320717 RepID=A0ABR2N157_9ASPA
MVAPFDRFAIEATSSSSSEESDKENIGPRACKFVNMDSCPKDGLAKAFLDDEAEEEDDSDGDRLRFQEVDEESETDEHEELTDLIATGNEEAPIDQEKRNELHQKWLEHQDAAETENVLQRLKCHQGFGRSSFIHGYSHCYDGSGDDDDDDDNDNCDDENTLDCDDEAAYKQHTTIHTVHQGLKKAKQMISQMFTDTNDVYIASDDEETERNFIRHHILKQNVCSEVFFENLISYLCLYFAVPSCNKYS